MVWCLSLVILSLIISRGADGELDSRTNSLLVLGWGIPQGFSLSM